MQTEADEKPRYAVVAAVQLPNVSDVEFEASLAELRDLAKTARRLGRTVTAGDDAVRMQKLLDVIEDLDDVQDVFHNAVL